MIANRYAPTGTNNSGGMGEIIECIDTHLDRKVILKKLQSGVEERRIIDEYKALAKLRSKHVVQLFDVIRHKFGGVVESAIVLEFIEGTDLEINTYTADLKCLNIVWQIACGLRDIHAAGVIHRDIKPGNIRVDQEGVAKIIDFGLARLTDEAKTRGSVGTPVYMAPELWGDHTVRFSNAVDVYAFGVTCLAIITAKAPIGLTRQPPIRPPRAEVDLVFSGFPSEYIDMMYACLDEDPTGRPNMQQIVTTLERQLLRDRHRALVVMGGKENWLHKDSNRINLNAAGIGKLSIKYDGFDFRVDSIEGNVFLNNSTLQPNTVVPGCCVITFGTGRDRVFVTFDISHPEVSA